MSDKWYILSFKVLLKLNLLFSPRFIRIIIYEHQKLSFAYKLKIKYLHRLVFIFHLNRNLIIIIATANIKRKLKFNFQVMPTHFTIIWKSFKLKLFNSLIKREKLIYDYHFHWKSYLTKARLNSIESRQASNTIFTVLITFLNLYLVTIKNKFKNFLSHYYKQTR